MSDKRIFELPEANTLNPGDKLPIDKSGFAEAKCIDASIILDKFTDLTNNKANKSDLTCISITGSKNNTGSTITSGSFFYKDGTLVRAKTNIANNATLTLNTNYETVTVGGLNKLNDEVSALNNAFISGSVYGDEIILENLVFIFKASALFFLPLFYHTPAYFSSIYK